MPPKKTRRPRTGSDASTATENVRQNTSGSSAGSLRAGPVRPANSARRQKSKAMMQQALAGSDNNNQAAAIKFPDGSQRTYPGVPPGVFDNCDENHHAFVLLWNNDAIAAVLPHLLKQRPAWFHQDHNTVEEFKGDLVLHCSETNDAVQESHGSDIIVPLTLSEAFQVTCNFVYLCNDPVVVAAYRAALNERVAVNPSARQVPPLATVHGVFDAARPANARAGMVARIPAHGVQAFI